MYDTMTDISDLADLRFEDLAEADLCDLVRRGGDEVEHCGRSRSAFCSRPSSPPSSSSSSSSTASSSLMLLLQGREAKAYTHITLINGERICLKEEDEDDEGGSGGRDEGEDGRYSPDSHSLDMDLNYVLQAGVVERVAPAFSTVTSTLTAMDLDSTCCSLDFDVELPPPSAASPAALLTTPRQPPKPQQSPARPLFRPAVKGAIVRPRASILASQLPLPVLASTRLLERTQLVATSRQQQQQQASFVISSAEISSRSASNNNNNTSQSSTSSNSINNNTNSASSLLRSALTSKAEAAAAAAEAAAATSAKPRPPPVKTMGGPAARKKSGGGGERQVEDIFLLSLEGRDAVARLKDGASQLFPNTRVSSEPAKELPNVISIEVDISGNLVLHKTTTTSAAGMAGTAASSAAAAAADHLAKVRKYQRRSREEPRKECRLLHHCHICNKGFKDKYSVNVHIRTHTGEKPFACQLCGKKFRQKAHLAKHHQTHAARPPGSEGAGGQPTLLQLGVEQQQQQQQLQQLQYQLEDLDEEEEEDEVFDDSDIADLDCISAAV
jgi:hypothetical protein